MVNHEIKSWFPTIYNGLNITELCMTQIIFAAMKNLTKREKEILQLIADEYTALEIAEKLQITTSTIETHRRNIFKKVGVKSSIGLIKEAMKLGWIE